MDRVNHSVKITKIGLKMETIY